MTVITSDIEQYCVCMESIKSRINFLDSILGGSVSLGQTDFDDELMALHLRKILELIAFSSMVANKEQYSLSHKNFAAQWKAKDLLDHLTAINPDFYPVPLKLGRVNPEGVKNFDLVATGWLTKEQFISLYDRCGGLLHAKNPYSSRRSATLEKADVRKWISHVQKLLAVHRARMFGTREGWLVVMQHESDGRVHNFPFKAR